MHSRTETREFPWGQHCRYWWPWRLSSWQPQVTPVTTKLVSWQLLAFNGIYFKERQIRDVVGFVDTTELMKINFTEKNPLKSYLNTQTILCIQHDVGHCRFHVYKHTIMILITLMKCGCFMVIYWHAYYESDRIKGNTLCCRLYFPIFW